MHGSCQCPNPPEDCSIGVCPVCGLACQELREGVAAVRSRHWFPRIAGYRLLAEIGQGGMGIVYKARERGLNRLVAIKVIADSMGMRRFRTEAHAIARLQHPHIVQIYKQRTRPRHGPPYFSMEFVEGGSLARQLAGKPWPGERAARLVETLARAIHYAHQQNVAHRDLKPANVLLAADGTAKISDFGLAKLLDQRQHITRTGSRPGTCSYMAPEQATGRPNTDWRLVDVYGLGAILYETLAGRPPFQAASEPETLRQILMMEPVPPRRLQPEVPRDLEKVCLQCLDKDPRRRYASAEALADDLGRFLRDEPVQARPVGPMGRLQRWCKRRPALATMAAALMLTLVAGFATSLVLGLQAVHHFHQEQAARLEAEEHYKALRQIMTNNVHVSATWNAWLAEDSPLPTALLIDAETSLSRLLDKRPDDQELRLLLADVLTRLGMRAPPAEAVRLYERAIRLWEQVPAELANKPMRLTSRASTYALLGHMYSALQQRDRALAPMRVSFRLWMQLANDHPLPNGSDPVFGTALYLGQQLLDRGATEEEIRAELKELRAHPELLGERGEEVLYDALRVHEHFRRSAQHHKAKQLAAGLSEARQAAAILEPYFRQPSRHARVCLRFAEDAARVGTLLRWFNATDEALRLAQLVNGALRQLASATPSDHFLFAELSSSWSYVGKALWELNHPEETLTAYQAALAAQRQACLLAPMAREYRQLLGSRHLQLGRKLCELGRLDEAEVHFRQQQALWPNDAALRELGLRELHKWAEQAANELSPEARQERQRYLDLCTRLERGQASSAVAVDY